MPLFDHPRTSPRKGTISADGNEQTVLELTNIICKVSGYIDFTNMASGDSTIIRTYMKLKSGGSYIKQGQRTLTAVQEPVKLMHIFPMPTPTYGFKITLQQTGGTNRSYDWMTFLEEL